MFIGGGVLVVSRRRVLKVMMMMMMMMMELNTLFVGPNNVISSCFFPFFFDYSFLPKVQKKIKERRQSKFKKTSGF